MIAYGLISLELYRGIKFDASQRKSSRGNNTLWFGVGFLQLQLKIRAVILRLEKESFLLSKVIIMVTYIMNLPVTFLDYSYSAASK